MQSIFGKAVPTRLLRSVVLCSASFSLVACGDDAGTDQEKGPPSVSLGGASGDSEETKGSGGSSSGSPSAGGAPSGGAPSGDAGSSIDGSGGASGGAGGSIDGSGGAGGSIDGSGGAGGSSESSGGTGGAENPPEEVLVPHFTSVTSAPYAANVFSTIALRDKSYAFVALAFSAIEGYPGAIIDVLKRNTENDQWEHLHYIPVHSANQSGLAAFGLALTPDESVLTVALNNKGIGLLDVEAVIQGREIASSRTRSSIRSPPDATPSDSRRVETEGRSGPPRAGTT